MNSQRAFWISGAMTLLVLTLMGGAFLARFDTPKTATTPVVTSETTENEALRQELAQAYSDLDQAYRTIEQLRQGPTSRKRHHREDHDDDEHEEHDD